MGRWPVVSLLRSGDKMDKLCQRPVSLLLIAAIASLLQGCEETQKADSPAEGTTDRVSISDGRVLQANGGSGDSTRTTIGVADLTSLGPGISGDGRFVVFDSTATNLVPGVNTNGRRQVYLHDRLTGQTELISVGSNGIAGNDDSASSVVTDDGDTVVFESFASNLVFNDTNNARDIFLRRRQARVTERVSQTAQGLQGICPSAGEGCRSYDPAINADGSIIAFGSNARLTPDDLDNSPDIYVLDRSSGPTLRRITAPLGPPQAGSTPGSPAVSADGLFIAFASNATNLITGEPFDGVYDVYRHDRLANTLRKVSVPASGLTADGDSHGPSLSGDGRFVAFWSRASNLLPGPPRDTGFAEIFVADMQQPVPSLSRTALGLFNQPPNGDSQFPSISRDGRFVAFLSQADNLVPAGVDGNNFRDVYRADRNCVLAPPQACEVIRISIAISNRDVDGNSYAPVIAADPRIIAFYSDATNLVPNDTNNFRDAFVRLLQQ
ncbi:MAG: hypothetical protein NW703_13525 [Nitrospiraceae bacterium]